MAKEVREVTTPDGRIYLVVKSSKDEPWRIQTQDDVNRDRKLGIGMSVGIGILGTMASMYLRSRRKP